ncbi:MAG: cell wall-active antibiotics response protein [Prevotellaceae bacterium]|jgi:predicted membrane protein|nr:cell wall-active antibiotics response protein [Prevotellaceae bacterium]
MANFHHSNFWKSKLIFSVLLILAGIVLLGLNFGFIPQAMKPILISWQMLVIILGVLSLFYRHYFSGIIMIVVGNFFMIPDLFRAFPETFSWASENFVHLYYPVLLIFGGILLVIYWLLPKKYRWCGHRHFFSEKMEFNINLNGERKGKHKGNLDKNVIFSGIDEIFLDEFFTGGELNSIFGGIDIDLRRTKLPEGDTYLEMNAIFGGINITVPNDWLIEFRQSAILGGFKDSRLVDEKNIDKSRKLIITGAFIFGGGEIKNCGCKGQCNCGCDCN